MKFYIKTLGFSSSGYCSSDYQGAVHDDLSVKFLKENLNANCDESGHFASREDAQSTINKNCSYYSRMSSFSIKEVK